LVKKQTISRFVFLRLPLHKIIKQSEKFQQQITFHTFEVFIFLQNLPSLCHFCLPVPELSSPPSNHLVRLMGKPGVT
jgi:hypothetical protein